MAISGAAYTPEESESAEAALRAVPVAALVAATAGMAWLERGSIAARHWLPYAVAAGIILVGVAIGARRPTRAAVLALGALLALAGWQALSLVWTPARSLGRDEVLLTLLYAVVFAVAAQSSRSGLDRLLAVALVGLGVSAVAVGTGIAIVAGGEPETFFPQGRLVFPVSYVNANAAFFLVGFWPAVVLAARRGTPVFVRAAAGGGAAALLAGWAMTQSKGGGVALAVSAAAVFGLCPARLRLLVPVAIAAVPVGVLFDDFTAPFREYEPEPLRIAVEGAGRSLLLAFAAAAAAALAYALVDARVRLGPRTTRAAGAVVLAAVAVGAAVGANALRSVDLGERWAEFKRLPEREAGASHFESLGSNRYDFWRVSLEAARDAPIAGVGVRGFGPVYLEEGRSDETPARAHSLPIELLLENGIVGLLLLGLAVGPPLALAARRLDRVPAVGVFGASVYFLVHAAGDWTWTFPAVGVPFFVLLGSTAGVLSRALLPPAARAGTAVAAAATALVLFGVPLASERLTERGGPDDLRWAKRLDPLTISPLLAEASSAATPAGRVRALRDAADREPDSVAAHYLLGLTYLDLGRKAEARRELREAQRLFPRDEGVIDRALRRAQ